MENSEIEEVQQKIDEIPSELRGPLSDGFHSFDDLYEFRLLYNAHLFNEWAEQEKYDVHKSKRHYEGEECFGGGWFIVVAMLPEGQISNHYELEYWGFFHCNAEEKAKYPYDGHTPRDVLNRLKTLLSSE